MKLGQCAAVGSMALMIACSPSTQPSNVVKGGAPAGKPDHEGGEVQVWGALRAVMHEGKVEGTVMLQSIVPGPHAYAVGALAGLRGEVTVLDDEIIVTLGGEGATVRTLGEVPPGEMATLLVRAVVPRWMGHTVAHSIETNRIDEELETIVKTAGLDPATRIPVVIEATARNLEWHVLTGRAVGGNGAHGAHHGPRTTGKLADAKVTLVGFFSRNDAGVFTHMGEHSHFHVVTSGERMTGHVDAMALEAGAVIRVPARP